MTFPQWLVKKLPRYQDFARTTEAISNVNTVCKNAACPNILECYGRGHVTFLILGDNCTRNCVFCAVNHLKPLPVDAGEPERVAEAAARLKLSHVVVTSVTRDDLEDGGAGQFALTIKALREATTASIEVLIPDFKGSKKSLERVVQAGPDVVAHNLETVQSLQSTIRPLAGYECSIGVLYRIKEINSRILTKSGLILGLGESDSEVAEAIQDLRAAGCDILTLGQYRQPSPGQIPVQRFILEEGFTYWEEFAYKLGFRRVFAGSYVRSSYRAGEIKDLLQKI